MVAGTGNGSTTIFNQYVDMFTFSDGPETAHPAAKAASATPPPSNPPSKGPTPLGVTYLEAVATTGSNKLICKTPNGTPNPLSPVFFPTPLSRVPYLLRYHLIYVLSSLSVSSPLITSLIIISPLIPTLLMILFQAPNAACIAS